MFGFLRKLRGFSGNTSADFPGAFSASQIIFLQLPFCDLDPISLCAKLEDDEFALGYLFGVADMANYQFNRSATGDQDAALNYIRHVFIESLGGDGEERFMQALRRQSSPVFGQGRQVGADDLGGWLQSQGQRHALGLARHFSELSR
ncbi:hypothetical protein [Paracoccus zhejiangensis]|uniref:hypothetical protein n=1 Tax=Paracoccus zhejiangensis TaxID=1077935 RepID=UPI0012FFDB8E|nr:hypothetical protein [Paracoccus zhejiangensis]